MFNLTQKAQFSKKSDTNTGRINRSDSPPSFDKDNDYYCTRVSAQSIVFRILNQKRLCSKLFEYNCKCQSIQRAFEL